MSGSLNIQCALLTDTNYTVWMMKMKVALKVHKVWKTIDPEENIGEKYDLENIGEK